MSKREPMPMYRTSFEYAWVYGDDAALSEHGREGWEAVGVSDDLVLMRRAIGTQLFDAFMEHVEARENVVESGNIEVEDADHPTDIDVHESMTEADLRSRTRDTSLCSNKCRLTGECDRSCYATS